MWHCLWETQNHPLAPRGDAAARGKMRFLGEFCLLIWTYASDVYILLYVYYTLTF